ncbi:MAG: DUF1592 domain-containing protein [Verrucomicrobiota bacterium]|nr:DUF1592 domain-containing protein [Verrucomicrobiota bacterium]
MDLELYEQGEQVFRALCVDCHGVDGMGVEGNYDDPLYGTRSLESLTRRVVRTMPEDDPESCQGEEALAVSTYIYHAFYSEQARARMGLSPRIEMARLTVTQHQNMLADLISGVTPSVDGRRGVDHALEAFKASSPGLRASYFQSKGMNKANEKKLERVDFKVDYDYGETAPLEEMDADQFAIIWEGGMFAPSTGQYEFRVQTQNGVRLYINSDPGQQRGKLRDDSSVAGQKPLVDGWVSSGTMRQLQARLFLLGGRHYPLRLEFFKYLEKTASIRLEWRTPHGVWKTMDGANLRMHRPPRTFVTETKFPADDRSLGYTRGSDLSWTWYQAVNQTAVTAASEVVQRLPLLAGFKAGDPDRGTVLRSFLVQFAGLAYRRPFTKSEEELYGRALFETSESLETAVRRGIVLALHAPAFLFGPWNHGGKDPDAQQLASRLALTLWDSMPDSLLTSAASQGLLSDPVQIQIHARRMLDHPRARFKLRGFFEHWLEIETSELVKKEAMFPGFDRALVSDLRHSLDLFLEDILWGNHPDFRRLLTADYLMLSPRLEQFYLSSPSKITNEELSGVNVEGKRFKKVRMPSGRRAGVLTHPYLLSVLAYHDNTSPIHRGVFLTRNVVGRSLKPPPMAVEFKDSDFSKDITMRQKVVELTKDRACMACHSVINPLGFALESFDAVGRWRQEDNGLPVNTLSEYLTEDGDTIQVETAMDIARYAIENESAHTAFVLQLFHHLIKQSPGAFDPSALTELRLQFTSSNFNMRELIFQIAMLVASFDEKFTSNKESL